MHHFLSRRFDFIGQNDFQFTPFTCRKFVLVYNGIIWVINKLRTFKSLCGYSWQFLRKNQKKSVCLHPSPSYIENSFFVKSQYAFKLKFPNIASAHAQKKRRFKTVFILILFNIKWRFLYCIVFCQWHCGIKMTILEQKFCGYFDIWKIFIQTQN